MSVSPPEGLRLAVLGLPVVVQVDDRAVRSAVERLLADFLTVGDTDPSLRIEIRGADDGAVLAVDGVVRAQGPVPVVLGALVTGLNFAAVDHFPGFAVHAGVVGHRGFAVAIPAASGAGKSTLVAACVRAGLDYVSDEALCIGASDEVVPYPKPLSLSAWSCEALGLQPPASAPERQVTAVDLGGAGCSAPLVLRHVVLPERGPSPALEARHRADAVAALLGMSFNHYKRPAAAVETVTRLATSAECWTLRVAEPLSTARFLADNLPWA